MTMTRPPIVRADECRREYEAPNLIEIGNASDLILGIVGGGFDGDFGMPEPQFEVAADDEPICPERLHGRGHCDKEVVG